MKSFRALYGKGVIVQWHYGNGADRPAASFHLSCEGIKKGDAPARVYFNVLAAIVYRKQLQLLRGRGILFAVADDVKILGSPEVITEVAEGFPALTWEEAGLSTRTVKNRFYVKHAAKAIWCRFLDSSPKNELFELPLHDIPDGSE